MMLSNFLFIAGTLLLSLNFLRPYGLAISDWLYFSALVSALIETFWLDRKNNLCWTRNQFIAPSVAILFGAVISTMNSKFLEVAATEIFQQIYVVTLFISLTWVMVRRGQSNAIVQAIICSGVFTAFVAIWDYWTGTNIGPTLSATPDIQLWGRYAGTLGHPNKLGYFLVITFALSLGKLMFIKPSQKSLFHRALWITAIAAQLTGIYLTGSLTAYVGFVMVMIVFFMSSHAIVKGITFMLAPIVLLYALLMIFGVIFGKLSPGNIFILRGNSVSTSVDRVERITGNARIVLYNQAFEQILQNPLIGVGYEQLSTSGLPINYRLLKGTVHNSFLQIWYVGGFSALLGWLIIYTMAGWAAFTIIRRHELSSILIGMASATFAILLMDQFQDAIYQREKWLVVGLLMAHKWSDMKIILYQRPLFRFISNKKAVL